MNEYKNKFSLIVKNITLDISLGFFIMVIMTPAIPFNNPNNVILFYRYWFFACFAMGLTNLIYENKNISILFATTIHFFTTIFIILITTIKTTKLINHNILNVKFMLFSGIFMAIIIFFICWTISYIIEVKKIKAINAKLEK